MTTKTTMHRAPGLMAILALGAAALAPVPATAQSAGPDPALCGPIYEGRTVNMTTSFNPGGGGDRIARLHAEMLTRHMPGAPDVRVENRPGGGDGIGANYFAQTGAPDGLDIFYANSNFLRTFVGGGDAVQYDPRTFRAIGGLNLGRQVIVVREEALANVTDRSLRPAVVGDTNGVRVQVPLTLIAADYLGHNYTWAIGYGGGDELVLAMLRGEIDVYGSVNRADLAMLITEGGAVPLFQDGQTRSADYPDTPTLWEMMKDAGKELTPEDKAVYDNWMAAEGAQHMFMAPKGTPDDILGCLRGAYAAMVEDPEFDERLAAIVGPNWSLVPGDEVAALVVSASTVTDAITERLSEIRRAHGLPDN